MKKWLAMAAVITLVILLSIGFALNRSAKMYFSDPDSIQVSRVERAEVTSFTEVTADIDLNALPKMLTELDLRVTFGYRGPFLIADEAWEIHGMNNGKPFHIMLGRYNVIYCSGDDTVKYRITNPEALSAWLETTA